MLNFGRPVVKSPLRFTRVLLVCWDTHQGPWGWSQVVQYYVMGAVGEPGAPGTHCTFVHCLVWLHCVRGRCAALASLRFAAFSTK